MHPIATLFTSQQPGYEPAPPAADPIPDAVVATTLPVPAVPEAPTRAAAPSVFGLDGERSYADWRRRLTRNRGRRSDGRWDPLTYAPESSAA